MKKVIRKHVVQGRIQEKNRSENFGPRWWWGGGGGGVGERRGMKTRASGSPLDSPLKCAIFFVIFVISFSMKTSIVLKYLNLFPNALIDGFICMNLPFR